VARSLLSVPDTGVNQPTKFMAKVSVMVKPPVFAIFYLF
jgi:hypothetical protein